jgi:hypothetical protein
MPEAGQFIDGFQYGRFPIGLHIASTWQVSDGKWYIRLDNVGYQAGQIFETCLVIVRSFNSGNLADLGCSWQVLTTMTARSPSVTGRS